MRLCAAGADTKTPRTRPTAAIEEEVDGILRAQLARTAGREESASETHALIAAAQRLDNLIHHRRTLLMARG